MASEFCRLPATDFQPVIARASARACRLDLVALRRKAAMQLVWPTRRVASRAEQTRDSQRRLAGREFLISDLRQKPLSAWRSPVLAVPHSAAPKARARRLVERKRPVRALQSDPPPSVSSTRDQPWPVPSRALPEFAPSLYSYRPRRNSLGPRSNPYAVAPAFPCALSRVFLRKCRRAEWRRARPRQTERKQQTTKPHQSMCRTWSAAAENRSGDAIRSFNSLGAMIRSGAGRASERAKSCPQSAGKKIRGSRQ